MLEELSNWRWHKLPKSLLSSSDAPSARLRYWFTVGVKKTEFWYWEWPIRLIIQIVLLQRETQEARVRSDPIGGVRVYAEWVIEIILSQTSWFKVSIFELLLIIIIPNITYIHCLSSAHRHQFQRRPQRPHVQQILMFMFTKNTKSWFDAHHSLRWLISQVFSGKLSKEKKRSENTLAKWRSFTQPPKHPSFQREGVVKVIQCICCLCCASTSFSYVLLSYQSSQADEFHAFLPEVIAKAENSIWTSHPASTRRIVCYLRTNAVQMYSNISSFAVVSSFEVKRKVKSFKVIDAEWNTLQQAFIQFTICPANNESTFGPVRINVSNNHIHK